MTDTLTMAGLRERAARHALEELERHGEWNSLEEMMTLIEVMLEAHEEGKKRA